MRSLDQPDHSFEAYAVSNEEISRCSQRGTAQPTLADPSANESELSAGDRVEGLGNFGISTGSWAPSNRGTKKTQSSNGVMTAVRDSASHG